MVYEVDLAPPSVSFGSRAGITDGTRLVHDLFLYNSLANERFYVYNGLEKRRKKREKNAIQGVCGLKTQGI